MARSVHYRGCTDDHMMLWVNAVAKSNCGVGKVANFTGSLKFWRQNVTKQEIIEGEIGLQNRGQEANFEDKI